MYVSILSIFGFVRNIHLRHFTTKSEPWTNRIQIHELDGILVTTSEVTLQE